MSVLTKIKNTSKKRLALLIDPDKFDDKQVVLQLEIANKAKVDFIFYGGSLISNDQIGKGIELIKSISDIPVVIFPGNGSHFHESADAILFLSLISGRNADLLIGNHVHVGPIIKKKKMEAIPTGYMLIESGKLTTAQYISNTLPIPHEKADVAVATAIAGEMLGLQLIYMDGGSGAENSISEEMIRKVKANISLPLVIGGGIRSVSSAIKIAKAGADIIVVGNAAEENPHIITEISKELNRI